MVNHDESSLTLRHRLLMLTLFPSALIAVALVIYFTISGIHTLEGELPEGPGFTVRYLAPISEYGIIAGQIESLRAVDHRSGLRRQGRHRGQPEGRTIAVSGRFALGRELHKPRHPGLWAETDQWIAFAAPVKRSMAEADLLFDPSPVANKPATPEIIGYVFVEFDKAELADKLARTGQRGLLIVLFGMLIQRPRRGHGR